MRALTLTLLLLTAFPLAATNITVGSPLPSLTITDRGELVLKDDEILYEPWVLPQGIGKVHVVQYMAGRMSARGQTKPFTDRLESDLPDESVHVTTVINLDDAIWGSTGFVVGEIKSNKRKYPDATMVLDEEGTGRTTWGLQLKVATTVVLDPGGSVLYFKEGAMSETEIESTLELIRQYL
jgi:YtfJ family uncharacterized protein